MPYQLPKVARPREAQEDEIFLIASGDSRLAANQVCWPAQANMEKQITDAFGTLGKKIVRAHPYDGTKKHGFIDSQRAGMDVFKSIPKSAPLVVAEAVWQYSYHVLAGLRDHTDHRTNFDGRKLVRTVARPRGHAQPEWFFNKDEETVQHYLEWITSGTITHDQSHVRDFNSISAPEAEVALGQSLAKYLKHEKAIMGVFDEGCMGMYNAIIDDELLNATGVYKERLSQAALVAEMAKVTMEEKCSARKWLDEKGMQFKTGPDAQNDLTDAQILEQMAMYIAAGRIANNCACDLIGIQYQLGLKDTTVASDLAEGLLNNVERPPIFHPDTGAELFAGKPIPHFNEVDEGAGLDILVTNRVWSWLGMDPATTLHDIRWGEHYKGDGVDAFVWVLEISGAVPPSHLGGYDKAVSERQPKMYFHLGGGGIKGVSKPGDVVWSRVYVENDKLHADIGRATSVVLPQAESQRRWNATTSEWPMMHAVLHGVTRDQLMGRHKANHVNVVYAPSAEQAVKALYVKAAMLQEMGVHVHLCGNLE